MPAGVGGVACTFVRLRIAYPKERVDVWQAPGIDGYGAMKLGLGESDFVAAAVLFGTAVAIDTWSDQIEALQGSIVSIVDDWGVTHNTCLITRVGPPAKTPALATSVQARGEIEIAGVKLP